MNGIHDMGGMDGFGPVTEEAGEPVFHTEWEGRTFAMTFALAGILGGTSDQSRDRIERIAPATYLTSSYYERWFLGQLRGLEERGVISAAEAAEILAGRVPAETDEELSVTPMPPEWMASLPLHNKPFPEDWSGSPDFSVGDKVCARNDHPRHHTRLVRYIRGHTGVVIADNGNHPLPEDNARGQGPTLERLYTVKFAATSVWGAKAQANDSLVLDLWASHIEAHING